MKVFTDWVPERKKGRITVGKHYEVKEDQDSPHPHFGVCGHITADNGQSFYILEHGCCHLDGKSWLVVEGSDGHSS